jgi:hypothetical protein
MAANNMAIDPPSNPPRMAVRFDPTTSRTARTSSVHSSQVGMAL